MNIFKFCYNLYNFFKKNSQQENENSALCCVGFFNYYLF